jgi:transcriptional regulator with XRE-family HTH domain
MIQPGQIRAARALLGWRQEDLSKASGVGTATVRRIENTDSGATSYVSTLARIQAAFEAAGIVFLDDDGSSGMGVRIARSKKSKRK